MVCCRRFSHRLCRTATDFWSEAAWLTWRLPCIRAINIKRPPTDRHRLMSTRRLHRIIGIVLLLPFLGWAITGFVFFVKPGYEGAYEVLSPKTYPLEEPVAITPQPAWLEFRYFRTVLGDHLIARTGTGWLHLNPRNLQPRSTPTEEEIKLLLADAFSANPQRYGHIAAIAGGKVRTDTGIEVALDWNRLSLQQRGRDTDRIDLLYRIHYLQWTGVQGIDRLIGLTGLALIVVLTMLGARLAVTRS
jgi:hypothetical protein